MPPILPDKSTPPDKLSSPKNSTALNLRPIDLERDYAIPRQTSANWRNSGRGPAFIRVSNRMVLYARADVEKWLAARTVTPGGDDR